MAPRNKSEAVKKALAKLEKTILTVVNADDECDEVERIVAGLKAGNRLVDVDFFYTWDTPTISVSAWDCDPADVIESVCGPLFQHFRKPWKMGNISDIKVIMTASLRDDLNLVVQVCSPVGCRFEEITETTKRMVCE